MKFNFFKSIGPGILVTAAFIGPGTVTVCLLAGNMFSFALLWAIFFAIFAAIVLQEMSARLGLVTNAGLSEAISRLITQPIIKYMSFGIIITGILIGNAAYEAGNISGTLIGLRMIVGNAAPDLLLNSFVYILAFGLLYFGTYKVLEKFFISIVGLMSISFIAAAIITRPDIILILKGLFTPTLPEKSIMTVVGLVGTTVVPYNLFLHAAMIKNKWSDVKDLRFVKRDTIIAVSVGGVISGCIIITGAFTFGNQINGISDLSGAFTTLYGNTGKYLFGFGIFAAGFTSTITAPLAASIVAKGLFVWNDDKDAFKIRLIWMTVLTTGFIFASLGYKPIEIIKTAQFANGLLLPLIAGFLIWVVNQKSIMGKNTNTKIQNIVGVFVLIIVIGLGLKGVGLLFA
ncbi:MAG: Nramp family divalent metal transporter [Saprospiraceae bacterium]|nr:Nramp family divalent metal transporter [Saprospiraceae bacterium]